MSAEDVAKKAIEAFNRHDAEAFAAVHAAGVIATDPQYEDALRGRESVKKDIQDFFTAFPDIQATPRNFIVGGDSIAFEVEITGTHKGPLVSPAGPIPATNRPMQMQGARFERINENGEITECHRYYDMAGLMMQLGLMPDA